MPSQNQNQNQGEEPIVVWVDVPVREAFHRGWPHHGWIRVRIDPAQLSDDDRQALLGAVVERYDGLYLTGDAGVPSELTPDGVLASARAHAEAVRARREQETRRWDEARAILGDSWSDVDEQRLAEGRLDRKEIAGRLAAKLRLNRAAYQPLTASDVPHDGACYEGVVKYDVQDEDAASPWKLTARQYEHLSTIRAEAQKIADSWADTVALSPAVTLRRHTARCLGCGERRRRLGVRVRMATTAGWSVSREYWMPHS